MGKAHGAGNGNGRLRRHLRPGREQLFCYQDPGRREAQGRICQGGLGGEKEPRRRDLRGRRGRILGKGRASRLHHSRMPGHYQIRNHPEGQRGRRQNVGRRPAQGCQGHGDQPWGWL